MTLGKPGGRRPGNAEGLPRNGVGERIGHTPLFLVITPSSQDPEGAVEPAGQVIVPLPVIHEFPVVLRPFLIQETHSGTAPDFTDATPGMTMQHEGRGVETLDGADVTSPGVNRFLPPGSQGSRCRHGNRQFSILPVVDESGVGAVIAIRIVSPSGIAIEMAKSPV